MRPARLPVVSLAVFLVVFATHFSCPYIGTGDSRWYIPTAMSIIRDRDTILDEYEEIVQEGDSAIETVNDHLYNLFPVGVSVAAVPFVFVIDRVASRLLDFDLEDHLSHSAPHGIELFIASFLVALTAVFIYLVVRRFLAQLPALLLVGVFAFCTSSWSTASRALWPHAPSMLMLTIVSTSSIVVCRSTLNSPGSQFSVSGIRPTSDIRSRLSWKYWNMSAMY